MIHPTRVRMIGPLKTDVAGRPVPPLRKRARRNTYPLIRPVFKIWMVLAEQCELQVNPAGHRYPRLNLTFSRSPSRAAPR